jgi:hypothetical protein
MEYGDRLETVRKMSVFQMKHELASVSDEMRAFLSEQSKAVLCDRDLCGFLGIDYARFGRTDKMRAEIYMGVVHGVL